MTTYSFVQIVVAVVATYQLVRAIYGLLRGGKRILIETLFLCGAWGAALVFALFPTSAQTLSESLGMGENLNTLIFTGFVILFWIHMHTLTQLRRQQRDITTIVRSISQKNIDTK